MKYVTIKDIANELHISASSVSRALRGDDYNVNKDTKQRILEMAEKMEYKRNELAANLRKQSTCTIGIVVPELITPFYMNFIIHAQEILNKKCIRVILAQSHEDPEAEKLNLQMMEDYRVDGILISTCHNQKNIHIYKYLISKEIPLVFFDRTIEDISVPKVVIDDYIKSFFMVEHLIRSGRRNVVHLAGPSYIQYSSDRRRAYQDALKKFHISLSSDYLIDTGVSFKDGEKSMEEIIRKKIPFNAVFCFTEMVALGAKSCLHKHKYQIPEDVFICCISGTALSTLVHPSISTLVLPVEQMAESAVQLLMEKLENFNIEDKKIVLDAELVFRGSTENKVLK